MGQSTQHHRFRFACAVVSVSVRGAAAPRTGARELHRQCFARVGQCAGAQIWPRLAGASCWISHRLRLGLEPGMRGSCGVRPLRQSYITPHCPQCPPVSRKLLLCPAPLRALRVKATGFMQNCLRWGRSHSRRRSPVVGTPYAPPSAHPCGCRGTVALVRRCALCGWSVACGQSCGVCPRPPLCFAAARHQPCALVCPSAPRGGSLSPRALVVGFCNKFSSCLRSEYEGCRPKRPISQRDRWLTFQEQIGTLIRMRLIVAWGI